MKPTLTITDFERAAQKLKCSVPAIQAVSEVESRGKGFYADGFPVILFERHKFKQFTQGRYNKSHPHLSGPQGGYNGGTARGRFNQAFALNPEAAMKSCSWGRYQIMGFNHEVCGYATVGEFVDAMKESEGKQLDAFVSFVINERLAVFLRSLEWAEFARGYNGPAYKKNRYDTKMATAYRKYSAAHPKTTRAEVQTNPANLEQSPDKPQTDTPGTLPNTIEQAAVVAVPALSAAPTDSTTPVADEDLVTKVGNRVNSIWTLCGTAATGIITWLSSNSLPLTITLMVCASLLGGWYMWLRERRAERKENAAREDKKLAEDREFELKKIREEHAKEFQLYSMRSVAEKDLTAVTICSPPSTILENSDS
jgi:hypothetical protein